MSTSKTDHGTVEVQVGAELYVLAFNLKAVKRIERALGGILPAMQEVQRFNLSAIIQVIVAGAGLALKPSAMEELEEEVYQAGIKRPIRGLSACAGRSFQRSSGYLSWMGRFRRLARETHQ